MKGDIMTYETQRLVFRPWTMGDAEECFALSSDEHVGPPCGWQPHKTLEDTRQVLSNILINDHTYCIIEKASGRIVGNMGINPVYDSEKKRIEDERELGFWLGFPYWNQGYMTEAARGTIDYCFSRLNVKKLWCGYFSGNLASARVQEKCGFQHSYTKTVFWNALEKEVELNSGFLMREDWSEKHPSNA